MADLEEARAILAAKLKGEQVEVDPEALDEHVVNAMSLIAQGYQSDSEEEGELDHENLKDSYIETKLKEFAEKAVKLKSGSEGVPSQNEDTQDVPSKPKEKKRRFKEKKDKRSKSKEREREREKERERRRKSKSLERKRERSRSRERREKEREERRQEAEKREAALRARRRTPSPFM